MHIVLLHHEKIPVTHYGGTERVIEALAIGFRDLGHKVTLISYQGDTKIDGINSVYLEQLGKDMHNPEFYARLIPSDADIIHFHLSLGQDRLDLPPYLVTLHGNLKDDEDLSTLPKNCVGISENHALQHNLKHFVYNGLDFSNIEVGKVPIGKRNYFAFLGRASLKRKGLHLAKDISKSCNLKLHIGGGRGVSFGNNKYLGHLDNNGKFDLLQNARGLLFPILWEEPFGLTMIEAMACGTPVFALNRGSVKEVLGMKGGEDLFIVKDSVDELIESINSFHYTPLPKDYRDYVDNNFSHMKMCEEYLKKYGHVIDGTF